MFLVLVDAHSKWMDVIPVHAATSSATIEKLRVVFATHGLPERIVTDNGAVFTSDEFEDFLKTNGVMHTRTAPYHPASNGLAERAVQTFKQGIKRIQGGSLETRLSRFLFKYRITPHTTTGRSPAELLLGRQPRSRLDLLHPDTGVKVRESQARQSHGHDKHTRARAFQIGDRVYVRNFVGVPTWLEGTILDQIGPVSFQVQLTDGRTRKRHVDHMRIRFPEEILPSEPIVVEGPSVPSSNGTTQQSGEVVSGNGSSPRAQRHVSVPPPPRRSGRIQKPPDRLC